MCIVARTLIIHPFTSCPQQWFSCGTGASLDKHSPPVTWHVFSLLTPDLQVGSPPVGPSAEVLQATALLRI